MKTVAKRWYLGDTTVHFLRHFYTKEQKIPICTIQAFSVSKLPEANSLLQPSEIPKIRTFQPSTLACFLKQGSNHFQMFPTNRSMVAEVTKEKQLKEASLFLSLKRYPLFRNSSTRTINLRLLFRKSGILQRIE